MSTLRSFVCAVLAVSLAGCQFGTLPPPTVGPPICNAQHSWKDYHLPHYAVESQVVIANHSSYELDLEAWNTLKGNPITMVDEGTGFIIEVRDGGDANSGWLGLASIQALSNGHIIKGTVTMNLTLLAKYGGNVARHVLAQELGHILGLGHQRNADDSAMDDCQGRGSGWLACLSSEEGTTPNAHDGEQLAIIYEHVTGDPPSPSCAEAEFQIVLHSFSAEDLGGDDHDHP